MATPYVGLLAHVATYDTSSPTEQMFKSASKKYTKGSKIVGIRIYVFFNLQFHKIFPKM